MSITTWVNNIFSKPKSTDLVGVALRQQSIAYCAISEDKVGDCAVIDNNGQTTLLSAKKLATEQPLSGRCQLVLSGAQSQIVQVDKPSVPEAEINSALIWQIKDLVSYPPENMVVDYFDGPAMVGGVEKINVVCTAKDELIGLATSLFTDNLTLETITTEEFAFASLLPVQPEAHLLVCQQPNEEIVILIVKNGQLFFSRRLRGFAHIANKNEDELQMGVVDSLSLEIQRSTDYFERQLKQAPIKAIEVLVPIAHETFLARKLAENTNVAVSIMAMPIGYEEQRESAVAIGATQLNFMESLV
jgi:MSHA biogenesis protein MshI